MATKAQRSAARRNVKKAQSAAKSKQTLKNLPAKTRTVLGKALALGGALCELPMAVGVVQLLFGGEMRTFLGATMVSIALRLSYRPFLKA